MLHLKNGLALDVVDKLGSSHGSAIYQLTQGSQKANKYTENASLGSIPPLSKMEIDSTNLTSFAKCTQ